MRPFATMSAILDFYVQGFRGMTLGRTLWALILLKLFILFAIFRAFLLPNYLAAHCETAEQKSELVANNLIGR